MAGTRLRPAARAKRPLADGSRAERLERAAAADDAILAAMATARLPIDTADLAALAGLSKARAGRRLRALRAACCVRWIPKTTGHPGWAFPRSPTPVPDSGA